MKEKNKKKRRNNKKGGNTLMEYWKKNMREVKENEREGKGRGKEITEKKEGK